MERAEEELPERGENFGEKKTPPIGGGNKFLGPYEPYCVLCVTQSKAVVKTLLEAIALVSVVVNPVPTEMAQRSPHAALLAVPVSIVGTIQLDVSVRFLHQMCCRCLGSYWAIGIVVDDASSVVENVEA